MTATPKLRRFIQADVFSPYPVQGNGLAVVVDADGLQTEQMQRFAAWTNLAETTFLLPPTDPQADYRVRIFTTAREMQFAGHPTLGSCAAWLHSGGKPARDGLVRQQCPIGLVDIDITGKPFAFAAPPTQIEPMPSATCESLADALQIDSQQIVATTLMNNGPAWQVLQLASAQHVLDVNSARVRWPETKSIGLIGAHEPGAECDYEVRMLAPSSGMSEDPITGSLNAALAHWLFGRGLLERPITMAQGTSINRHGRVSIRADQSGQRIMIGGDTHILIEGTVTL